MRWRYIDPPQLRSIGEWQYGIRSYDIAGKNVKPYVNVLHAKKHWTNLNAPGKTTKYCQCGEEIPAVLRAFILLVESGYWFAYGNILNKVEDEALEASSS